jgi:hypothetical protein
MTVEGGRDGRDNSRAHKVAGVRETIEAAHATLFSFPLYSPDLSPIELCWSKGKAALREQVARTREALAQAWATALPRSRPVTPSLVCALRLPYRSQLRSAMRNSWSLSSKLFSILPQIFLTCSALSAALAWFEHDFERAFLTFALSDKCYTGNPGGQAWRFSGYFRNPRAGDCVALQEEKCVARRPLITATGWQ